MITASAWECISRDLLIRLGPALSPTIRVVQSAVRAAEMSMSAGRRIESAEIYDPTSILTDVFKYFPGAAETAAKIIEDWIVAQVEMLRRLDRDVMRLEVVFPNCRPESLIVAIKPAMSDLHDAGRSVAMITFESGNSLIYKPRSSDGERIWFGALHWMNQHEFPVRFRIPKILSRKRFFWMEFLQRKDCENAEALRRFYFRWGAQAALAQILELEDLHRDNWLACGEDPILLDTEMACQPRAPCAAALANWMRLDPLLRTGLLPIHNTDGVGLYRGIAPFDATTSRLEKLYFWPRLHKKSRPPSKFIDDLIKGYRATIQFISASNREKRFLAQLIRLKDETQHRIIYRPTAAYYSLLRQSYSPKFMIDRGARFDHLRRKLSNNYTTLHDAASEARALFRACIPRFTGNAFERRRVTTGLFAHERLDSSRLLRLRVTRSQRRTYRY